MTTYIGILAAITALAIMVSKVAEAVLAVHKLLQDAKNSAEDLSSGLGGGQGSSRFMLVADIAMQVLAIAAFFTLFYWMVRPPSASDTFSVQCGVALLIIIAIGPRKLFR